MRADIKWVVEGDDPNHYLDVEASLARFQELVAAAVHDAGLEVTTIPVTIRLSPTLGFHGRVSGPGAMRLMELASDIWESGDWQVAESAEHRVIVA